MSELRNSNRSTPAENLPQTDSLIPQTAPCGRSRILAMTSFQHRAANLSPVSSTVGPVLIGDALASAIRALPHDRLRPIAEALEKR